MKEYKIIIGSLFVSVQDEVNKHLEEGFLLAGGVSVIQITPGNVIIAQSVYKSN